MQDKHRHKSSKSRKDEREEEEVAAEAAASEYRGRVTDAKDFTPVTKKVGVCLSNDTCGAVLQALGFER